MFGIELRLKNRNDTHNTNHIQWQLRHYDLWLKKKKLTLAFYESYNCKSQTQRTDEKRNKNEIFIALIGVLVLVCVYDSVPLYVCVCVRCASTLFYTI